MHYCWRCGRVQMDKCSRDPEEVQDDGLHDHTYGIEHEALKWCFIRDGWCYDVSSDDWVLDVLKTRYLLCCEHIETCSPDGCKACKGTVDYGLKYDANQKINLEGYVDSDWAGSAIDRKSTSWCCFSMGSGVISWFSRKNPVWHWVQLKQSMLQLVQLVVRQYG